MRPKNLTYKYCVVPECKNTTKRTPNKLFFSVPVGEQRRRDWCSAMGRKRLLGPNTSRYCCEDHFDVENDMENYIRWKLYGVSKKVLKKDVLPHKFACQNYTTVTDTYITQSNNSLHIKEEITDHDSSTLSCNSDSLSCDSETEARLKEIHDVQVKKEIVHELLPENEHIDDVDPLAIEVPNAEDAPTKPYVVNMVYVADLTKQRAIIKL